MLDQKDNLLSSYNYDLPNDLIAQSKIFLTGHIDMIYSKTEFPRGISGQTISDSQATADDSVRSGPGLKPQASSSLIIDPGKSFTDL